MSRLRGGAARSAIHCLGIDLGASEVRVATREVHPLTPFTCKVTSAPATVAMASDGELLTGWAAEHQVLINAGRSHRRLSEMLGSSWSAEHEGAVLTSTDLLASLLDDVVSRHVKEFGGDTRLAVVSAPVTLGAAARVDLVAAAADAGIEVLACIDEAAAVAGAVGSLTDCVAPGRRLERMLLIDVGCRMVRASVIQRTSDDWSVVATTSDSDVGGDPTIARLCTLLLAQANDKRGVDSIELDETGQARLRHACEVAVRTLSNTGVAHVDLPFLARNGRLPVHLYDTVTRSWLDAEAELVAARVAALLAGSFSSNLCGIDLTLIAGGWTKDPEARSRLVRALDGPVHVCGPREHLAARGAALHGTGILLRSGAASERPRRRGLGVELGSGVARVLLPAHSSPPCQASRRFVVPPAPMGQTAIRVLDIGDQPDARSRLLGLVPVPGVVDEPGEVTVTFRLLSDDLVEIQTSCSGQDFAARIRLP